MNQEELGENAKAKGIKRYELKNIYVYRLSLLITTENSLSYYSSEVVKSAKFN